MITLSRQDNTNKLQLKNSKIIIYILVIFFFFLFFTIQFSTFFRDDISFLNRLNEMGWISASLDHYHHWSSRIVLELAVMFFSKHFFLWKIAYSSVLTGFVFVFSYFIFKNFNKKSILLSFFVLSLQPPLLMDEAGWVATSLNYAFPLLTLSITFLPVYKLINNETSSTNLWIMSFFLLIFGGNQEQFNLCFLVLILIFSPYLIKNKKWSNFLIPLILLSLFHLFIFLTAPGNRERMAAETITWFPDFGKLNLINKFDLGFSSFVRTIFLEFNLPVLIFFILLAVLGWLSTTSLFIRTLSLLPSVTNLLFVISSLIYNPNSTYQFGSLYTLLFNISSIKEKFSDSGTGLVLKDPSTWYLTILGLLLTLSVTIALIKIIPAEKKGLFASLLFLMATCSRIILGFSPTVWASGLRTFYLAFVIIAILSLLLIKEITLYREKFEYNILPFLSSISILNYFSLFLK